MQILPWWLTVVHATIAALWFFQNKYTLILAVKPLRVGTREPPSIIRLIVLLYSACIWYLGIHKLPTQVAIIHVILSISWIIQRHYMFVLSRLPLFKLGSRLPQHQFTYNPVSYEPLPPSPTMYQPSQQTHHTRSIPRSPPVHTSQSQSRPYRWFNNFFRSKPQTPINDQKLKDLSTSSEQTTTTENGTVTCIVCLDKTIDTMLSPCNHLQCCSSCAQALVLCPVCRKQVETKIKVYAPFN